ncbi:hypothetical protein [Rubricoccus marinus]|uniref:Uncharacterized protein n=1 Tax=Rubricoccus marinus TaxID=716817 RepID=A0A259U2F6_9BACT|nr:hypothetical protein [Rubricoccus marinus]OZC04018.1 hypothetical protein BSZ36_14120 [Rubricoccus marinus]
MEENTLAIRLASRYEASTPVRALVQLIPFGIGSAADVAIVGKLEAIREDRARTFLDGLALGQVELTSEVIESEDFLHAFFSTYAAAMRARRREKTRLLADLLLGAVREDAIAGSDEYEELVSTLDSLSYREIRVLAILDAHESENERGDEDVDVWFGRHKEAAEGEICAELDVSADAIPGVMRRLARSAFVLEPGVLYRESDRTYSVFSDWEVYYLSDRYHRLTGLLRSGRSHAV